MIQTENTEPGTDWLKIARECYDSSTSYVDSNWRKQWERNISLFQSKHPGGSKYNSDAFKARSRLFRPKTKANVRKNEAAAAAAFFSNVDVVSVEPENDANPQQKIAAVLNNELLNYRLTKTIPWFTTLLGAFQEAQVIGIVASYQYWMYREKVTIGYEPVLDDTGQPLTDPSGQVLAKEKQNREVLEDRPCCDLIPIENLRFDPGAKWNDVVATTPYLIRAVPMYIDDVRQMMKSDNPKTGKSKWKEFEDSVIRASMQEYDTTRQARERGKQDPLKDQNSLKEFEIVWCHENFVRVGGEEMVYWTLGTNELLTDPIPLKDAYFHGKRPIVIGCAVLEAHKPMPDSLVGIGSELQKEANDLTNQRMDNVRLVLNKRWIIKRGKQIDTGALMRNVPGGAIMADDPALDLVPVDFQDVTGSSYQEQDRLNIDFDSLVGNFDQSSVQTNRKLNETVGGMNLAAGGASTLTEYLIRTFVETWVEQVLIQLVLLEQEYETDEVLLSLVAGADSLKEFGIQQVSHQMLGGPMSVSVNVGMGATDPQKKMGKFIAALSSYGQAMQMSPDFDPVKLRTELFGLAGYKNAERFFKQQGNMSPEMMQMQQKMQQMGQIIQELQQELQGRTAQAKIQAEAALKKAAIDSTARLEVAKISQETAIDVANINSAVDEQGAYLQARTDMGKAQLQSDTQLKTAAINATQKSMVSTKK